MMKKSILALGLMTVVGTGAGLCYAKSQIEHKVSEQVVEVVKSQDIVNKLKNTEVEQQIVTNINTSKTSVQSENKISTPATVDKAAIAKLAKKDNIKTPVDAVKFAERKIPTSEKIRYIELYNNRKNLTQEQKQTAKAEVLSHFTPEEIAMLAQAVQK